MREVIEILKKRIYAIAHAGVFIKINGVESMLTEIKGIEEAALEIEALLPKWIKVYRPMQNRKNPDSSGFYWTIDEYGELARYLYTDNRWLNSQGTEELGFEIEYWTTEEDIKKLLPKGE